MRLAHQHYSRSGTQIARPNRSTERAGDRGHCWRKGQPVECTETSHILLLGFRQLLQRDLDQASALSVCCWKLGSLTANAHLIRVSASTLIPNASGVTCMAVSKAERAACRVI